MGNEARTLCLSKLRDTRSRVGVTEEGVVEEASVSGEYSDATVRSIKDENKDMRAPLPPPAAAPDSASSTFASLVLRFAAAAAAPPA